MILHLPTDVLYKISNYLSIFETLQLQTLCIDFCHIFKDIPKYDCNQINELVCIQWLNHQNIENINKFRDISVLNLEKFKFKLNYFSKSDQHFILNQLQKFKNLHTLILNYTVLDCKFFNEISKYFALQENLKKLCLQKEMLCDRKSEIDLTVYLNRSLFTNIEQLFLKCCDFSFQKLYWISANIKYLQLFSISEVSIFNTQIELLENIEKINTIEKYISKNIHTFELGHIYYRQQPKEYVMSILLKIMYYCKKLRYIKSKLIKNLPNDKIIADNYEIILQKIKYQKKTTKIIEVQTQTLNYHFIKHLLMFFQTEKIIAFSLTFFYVVDFASEPAFCELIEKMFKTVQKLTIQLYSERPIFILQIASMINSVVRIINVNQFKTKKKFVFQINGHFGSREYIIEETTYLFENISKKYNLNYCVSFSAQCIKLYTYN